MGRPRSINIDPDQLLAGVHRENQLYLAAIREENRVWSESNCHVGRIGVELGATVDWGMTIAFDKFLGYWPTPSERIRAQEALRALESARLVAIAGAPAKRVKLTALGLARLRVAGLIPPEPDEPPAEPTT